MIFEVLDFFGVPGTVVFVLLIVIVAIGAFFFFGDSTFCLNTVAVIVSGSVVVLVVVTGTLKEHGDCVVKPAIESKIVDEEGVDNIFS